MGFFQRLANLWNGFFGLWMSDMESRNPEVVYEAAIQERVERYQQLRKAVGNIVYLRNKIADELEAKEAELREIQAQIPVAVEEGEDEAAIVLIEKKDVLTKRIGELSAELDKVSAQAEDAKTGLMSFQAEIEKLRREKDEMLAAKANAEARIQIQETLSGLSTEADVQALESVRSSISKLKAEADVSVEIQGDGLDAKLAKIKAKAKDASARQQLDEMKKQMAARKAASEGAAVERKI